ncbi:Fas1 domain, partial [Thalictrum thalictroides]
MAASRFFNFVLLLSVFSVLLPIRGGETPIVDHNNNGPQFRIDTEKIAQALSDAGYLSMSLSLEVALPTVISSTINTSSVITIFAPPDDPFYKFKYYRQPPITLLQYHVAPTKLDQETLRSPATPHGSKIDTFLP